MSPTSRRALARTSSAALCAMFAACTVVAPHREPLPTSETAHLPPGWRCALPLAELYVPDGFVPPPDGLVPLSVHFQGGVPIAIRNFAKSGAEGVLIASTLSGLSSAFRKPYEDPQAFRALLAAGERALGERCGRAVHFAPITLTFFSAGYGAVREILKHDDLVAKVATLVSADSIYADVVAPGVRAPLVDQMLPFLRFAQAAARGEKTFVLAHSRIVTPYASTAETADLLIAAVGAKRVPADGEILERGIPITAKASAGRFVAYEFADATPQIHVDLLWAIPELLRRHAGATASSAQFH